MLLGLAKMGTRCAKIVKEALALILEVQEFYEPLRGQKFTLLTDHKPLLTIFNPNKDIPTTIVNHLQHWAICLMGFTFDIEYCGTNNFGQAGRFSHLLTGLHLTFGELDPVNVRFAVSNHQVYR